jgi:hypothetical protein
MKKLLAASLALVCLSAKADGDLKAALASRGDLWGDQAIQQPGGPSYAFFEKLLPPLRYVNTSYREYPLVLSAPLAQTNARLISNGSAVNVPTHPEQDGRWWGYPVGLTFHVGASDEIFGQDHTKLTGPRFDHGYLPIVHTSYKAEQQQIDEEAFVPAHGAWADHAAVFVKFSTPQRNCRISAAVDSSTPLHLQGNSLLNAKGQTFVLLDDHWQFDEKQKRLTASLDPQHPLMLAVFTTPAEPPADVLGYDQLRQDCIDTWEKTLARCAQIDVPEDIVNRAWKSSVIANLMIAGGDKMYYSAANAYQDMWVAENGDSVRAMAAYGLSDTAKAMLSPILQIHQQGLDYHNAGFKLQLLANMYWLTRDASLIEKYRPLWQPEVDLILKHRQNENGLLPKEFYCGDITNPVYSLNSNANSWRGLCDIAAALDDAGDHAEAAPIATAAADFHTAILAAIAKSERTDFKPDFIPVALFGEEKPYDVLTATKMGTYWELMIPYILGSGILDEPRTTAVLDYLQTRGGLCMGMLRIHQHSGLFANEDGLDDGYTSRYFQAIAQRDDVDRMLVSFYGKLAQGFTRDTFVGAEGSSLVPLDPGGRPMYLPPNTTSNAFFMMMLRTLLVQDTVINEPGPSEKLRLLFATPRAWLEDGKTINAENVPTNFGPVSIKAHSDLSHGQVSVEVSPPQRAPKSTEIRLRLPEKWTITSANIGEEKLSLGLDGAFDITSHHKRFLLQVAVAQSVSSAKPHTYADHFNLLQYMDDQGQLHPVKTAEDWQRRRQDILLAMQQVMGDLPPRDHLPPLDVQITERFTGDGFERLKLTYVADGQERIPA